MMALRKLRLQRHTCPLRGEALDALLLQFQRLKRLSQNSGAAGKSFLLGFVQLKWNRRQHTLAADEVGQRQRDAIAIWHAGDARTN